MGNWHPRRAVIGLILAVAPLLSACFQGEKSLISPGSAAFPFQKILFETGPGAWRILVKDDSGYIAKEGISDLTVYRLSPIKDGFYVVQEKNTEKTLYAFAIIRLDIKGKKIKIYNPTEPEEGSPLFGKGFHKCDSDTCIDDLKVFVDYAMKAIADGATPDSEYNILGVVE